GLTDVRAEPEHGSEWTLSQRGATRGSFSSFELIAAGSPARRLHAHLEAGVDREGPDVRRGDEFVQYGDAGKAGALAVRAGRFDAVLPFLSNDSRLTVAGDLAPLAFAARGVELDGARADWSAGAGLSLSDRTLAGGASPRPIHPPLEDTYFMLGRRFGAQTVGAQMLFDRQDSHLATLSWLQHMRCQLAAQVAMSRVTLVPARYEHDYRTRNTYDPEDHRQQEVLQLAWQAVANALLGLECARNDDRLAHQGNADLEAFAQASW